MNVSDSTPELYIGLMSGTSIDGVDGVLIDLAPGACFRILAHHHVPFDPALRQSLFELNAPGPNELHRAALAANGVAVAYAGVVTALLQRSGVAAAQVRAIGAHGQTVRHRPGEFDGVGYTCQLLNAALLAQRTGIDVVADFRSRDVAAGGQGAPLVPAFHHAAFAAPDRDIAVLNVGGIANISFLPTSGQVSGHDCGPGNVLMDLWCARHTGRPFDDDGRWARTGRVSEPLLQHLLRDDYLKRPPPKSTGRDHFNDAWLQQMLATSAAVTGMLAPQDVQRTLVQFTADAAAADLQRIMPTLAQLLVCGGGALNGCLMDCLQERLPGVAVQAIDSVCPMDPMQVEAAAFAWLARACCEDETANLPAVTGAGMRCSLGALYRALLPEKGLGPMLELSSQPAAEPASLMLTADSGQMLNQLDLHGSGDGASPELFQPEQIPHGNGELFGYNLFLAIVPDEADSQRIGLAGADLRTQDGLRGRHLQDRHLLMTLHAVAGYRRDIPLQDIEAAKAAAASVRCARFNIRFDRVGSFSNRGNPQNNAFVLRCDTSSETSIGLLRQQLAVALRRSGLRPKPTATPHMPLLYDRKVAPEHAIEPIQMTATRFALILSHVGLGHHQWLGEWRLA